MFEGGCTIVRKQISSDEAREIIRAGIISVVNPSHEATISMMRKKFGIEVTVPPSPPKLLLRPGEKLVIMSVRGLPRLTDRHEYKSEDIDRADISFALYERKE
jgi:hypothetical protein